MNHKKHITITAALTAAAILPASATLLVYEPFDYAATTLTGQGGALGTTGVWNSNDSIGNVSWAVHQEGVLSGVVLSDSTTASTFDGTVDNLSTSGGYVGYNQGGNNLNADIGLDPTVTATFTTGATTWISYVSARAWDRNEEHANFVLATDPTPNGSRGDNFGGIGTGGSGFGTGGGPTRNNRTDIYPMFYNVGQYSNVNGAIPGNAYSQSSFEVSPADGFVWREFDADNKFGAPNIVVMKLEWDADTGGQDIITVVNFLEEEEITEAAFDAKVAAQTNLSSANWPEANKPNLTQGDLDTITFTGVKYFVDEIRIATTFDEIVAGGVAPPPPFALNVTSSGGNLEFDWPSKTGKFYNIYHSADLSVPLANWTLDPGNASIGATPDSNTKSIPLPGVTTFYYLEEFVPPPLLDADFEGSDDGFTVKAGGIGSPWERGTPDSFGLGGTVDGGAGTPASAECWGTNLGAYDGGSGNDGRYIVGTETCLLSPDIDLTNVAGATLSFSQALDIESADVANVNVYNANTDALLTSFPITDSDTGNASWEDIGPLALPVGTPIYLEWCLEGDTDEYLGWYIDNVLVERAAP